ncbi:MAG: site-specific DNA-methyltransferase [Armatimonadetes bacterium]|nr:site-specific DNA-methyltransferase [Armatimonadota bacterium]
MPRQPKSANQSPTPIESVKHQDSRANIPTEELRDFVEEAEKAPKTVLYPRDESLDPQLVWQGKDEQNRESLEVPAVPIYIQEKIHPQALIEDLRAEARQGVPRQASLFDDFNGIEFEELIEFYRHQQHWSNRMILGDSLLVMTSLAEKEGLKGQVQMIYLDPPYGIKFGSNWQVSTRKRDVKDGKAEDLTRQPEQIKAFRDTWEKGIHSYLTYLRDRLVVARELLTESGSIFVQIGDENVHLVRCVLDEVFGSENFVSLIYVAKTSGFGDTLSLASVGDYLIWYAKDISCVKYRQLYLEKTADSQFVREYRRVESPDGTSSRGLSRPELETQDLIPPGWRRYRPSATTSQGATGSGGFEIDFEGGRFALTGDQHWKTSAEGMSRLIKSSRIIRRDKSLSYKRYLDDFPVVPYTNNWVDLRWGFDASEKRYVVETNPGIVVRCLLMTTDPGDLVLDPTCGSGTTAYVAEQWGRRWITCDTSRVAIALARTRLMAAKYPYFLLSDSPEGVKREAELTGQLPATMQTQSDIKKGFVYKRVPHITLKAIANNPEIDTIHAHWQEKMEPIRTQINRLLSQSWEEWQLPREPESAWPAEAKELLEVWWNRRQQRQQAIDAAIAKNADTELLYDQPFEDNKRIRVTGPFTVESLSPHRVLSADTQRPATESAGQESSSVGQFEPMIIGHLKKAGVQNTRRSERLVFDRLDAFAGTYLHAEGEYTESGQSKRVAVCIGPEHGTVGPDLIKDAAKEAVQGIGFDLLVICGFAFDPHVSEEVKRYGNLQVLIARMNPDLAMGDDLLKKTGAGNLFMVFGEPDLEVTAQPDGKLVVEIKGVDIYDPTTGQIRNSSTDDIACWFIDTDYNEESFFVRHAYFTGAEEPYEKLKRALRAEIAEAAWSALYQTLSRPFDRPESGKIAVKVINHYGDEVLKVCQIK